jgi:hypothetical protein
MTGTRSFMGRSGLEFQPGPWHALVALAGHVARVACGVGLAACGAVAWAESIARDPKTRCEIIWVEKDIPPGKEDYSLAAATWSGPVVNGKAHGRGTLTVTVRAWGEYGERKGQALADMADGRLHGQVDMKWTDGSTFVGHYKNGVRHGRGRHVRGDGMSFEGEWIENWMTGRVVITHPDGTVYDGDIDDSPKGRRLDGKGTIRYPNGSVYEGEVTGGQPSGAGVLRDHRGMVVSDGPWGLRRNVEEDF